MNRSLGINRSDKQTQCLQVNGSTQAMEDHEDDKEDNTEEKYEKFRNMSSKAVQEWYWA